MVRTLRHFFHPHAGNNHRPRLLHPSGFFALAIFALVFHLALRASLHTSTFGSILSFTSSITSREVLALTNEQRKLHNLPPLQINEQLNLAASSKAANMLRDQYWSHISPRGTLPWKFIQDNGYLYSVAGENLARDFSDTPHMISAWMSSPTHKENIVNPKYKDIGIAVVDGRLLGTDTTLVVQMFGSPLLKTGEISTKGSATSTPSPATLILGEMAPPSTPTNLPRPQLNVLNEKIREEKNTISPLAVSKAVFVLLVALTLTVLIYDTIISSHKNTVRIAGKNLAHIFLLTVVLLLLLLYRGGTLL